MNAFRIIAIIEAILKTDYSDKEKITQINGVISMFREIYDEHKQDNK